MKYFNSLLIACLMFTLMGCPWLDSPPPLSPLPIAKSSNTAFKAATQQCRLVNEPRGSYQYDAAGNLIAARGINFTYNQAGLITQATWFGIQTTFTYDANNQISLAKSTSGTLSNTFKYTNGVFTAHEQIDNSSGVTTTISSGNSLGQASNYGTLIFRYDGRGNLIEDEDNGTLHTYEYDDKINSIYQATRFLKGQGSAFNPSIFRIVTGIAGFPFGFTSNNPVKQDTRFLKTTLPPTIDATYTYTYNARGLPLTRSVNGEAPTPYTYENCQ